LLAALTGVFHLGFRITGVHGPFSPLELAGAFLSPLLGMTLVAFLWWWGRKVDLANRNAVLAIAAVSPILAHGFQPDAQTISRSSAPVGRACGGNCAEAAVALGGSVPPCFGVCAFDVIL
jgi:hypothetical protein